MAKLQTRDGPVCATRPIALILSPSPLSIRRLPLSPVERAMIIDPSPEGLTFSHIFGRTPGLHRMHTLSPEGAS